MMSLERPMKVSIIMPVYNEERAIIAAVNEVAQTPFPQDKEIIVVNDGSTDGTYEKLKSITLKNFVLVNLPKNKGKGAAIRAGIEKVTGDIVLIQDADLEYSPKNYPDILRPILEDKADVVFGSRFLGGGEHRVHLFWHYIVNKGLTTLSNVFTNLNLTDMEVGFKVFRTEIIKKLTLRENRFGFEPEVTAKVARLHCRIYEVSVSYFGRSYDEGKKIGWKDGVSALRCILRYGIFG
jgi:glycosyltransferase involved in cell wall biosynthesis